MGNLDKRAETGVAQITGGLIGQNLLNVLKEDILKQKVFRTIFNKNIFIDEMPSYNDTILPAWEFRFNKELIEGFDLRHIGTINSRVLFPNSLIGNVNFHRKVALAIARYFKADRKEIFSQVSGLTQVGENLDITYDMLFVQGAVKVPSIVIKFPFILDIRRYLIENPEIPLDDDLDADLIKDCIILLEVSGVDEVNDTKTILIPKSKL